MEFARNTLQTFQIATTLPTGTQCYLVPKVGTSSNNIVRTINITDVKLTCGTAVSVRIASEGENSAGTSRLPMRFRLGANSNHNYAWTIPYKISVVSSTGIPRGIYASASNIGVRAVISGYYD